MKTLGYSIISHHKELSLEIKLILELLKDKPDMNYLNAITLEIDWKHFLELVVHHRVYSVIYPRLNEENKTIIPESIKNKLFLIYRKNTFKMLQLCQEMEYISSLFNENDIKLLVLKGPILATVLYGDISLRTSSDLDVLVPLSELDKVEKLLFDQGYIKDEYILSVLGDWKWRHHHFTYTHPIKNIKLEIHWRLNPGPALEPSFIELWNRRSTTPIFNNPIHYLSSEDLFFFLVSHGARHGWSRLRWLVDIHQILKVEFDWNQVLRMLRRYGYENIGGQALVLASQLLNSPLDDKTSKIVNRKSSNELARQAHYYLNNMINLHSEPLPQEVANYHKRHLFSIMSIRNRLLFILSMFHPYPEDKEVLPLPKKLHLLYIPLRPFIWLWKKTKMLVMS